MKSLIKKIIKLSGYDIVRISKPKSKIEADEKGYQAISVDGNKMYVDTRTYIGKCLIEKQIWEQETSHALKRIIQPGFTLLDIGANIGYFTLMFARLTGPTGKVRCFEPTQFFGNQLKKNISLNPDLKNIQVFPFGLSDKNDELEITFSDSTATLHYVGDYAFEYKETIHLKILDQVISNLNVSTVDVIKVDIDGHEPFFIKGSKNTLLKYKPILVMEFAQHSLVTAGSDARELYKTLTQEFNYRMVNEKTLVPYKNEFDFMLDCGNYINSGNTIAVHESKLDNFLKIVEKKI